HISATRRTDARFEDFSDQFVRHRVRLQPPSEPATLGISYGKGGIVGVAGEMEHGGACVHPMLGKPMRAAIGGGKAVMGSNVKVAHTQAHLSREPVPRSSQLVRRQQSDRASSRPDNRLRSEKGNIRRSQLWIHPSNQ